ncbi:transcriptional regulator [Agrobacterium tumefaciens]|uniref:DJ-1/PfpI family protein n=1 Tax=Agrobacterium TaxID=357 RepID=UPI00115D6DBA|nr:MULTISPECIES: DJ-1/PfpI family protein [Agrobacterium]MDA5241526.1 DJ-1/PfpI family protein [Agrobacterium sp. MAFF310724]MDA5249296.1 DJ-1/PfpI family protein [Agrobacterium sp. MAFF210268]MDO3445639.1 DJ-1/PfpI family protein [Agrobacterium sp. V1]TRB13754.1 transcriptional regulator [Agrobacterium tumefaciens]UNZ54164.1 DJ-1/PfpI family protein [Agrobacterium tumefaciens]
MQYVTRRTVIISGIGAVGGLALGAGAVTAQEASKASPAFDASRNPNLEKIAPYQARFGRTKPLVAVVGLNEGTVISDFCIPFGVMARSDVADVVSVSVKPGPVKMHPLTFELQSTIDDFDKRYPEGADYLFVPAVSNFNDANLLQWVKAQSEKGGTIISICYGALPVANTGLFDGHRATSHYSNEEMRAKRFPKVKWQKNIRYVADGKFVSSAGVTASMPTSIALVEAIAGEEKAAQVARDVGIGNWDSRHNSDVFKADPDNADMPDGNAKPEITIGIPVKEGDDAIALSLTAEAYSTTGVTTALAIAASKAPLRLAHGLVVLPDLVTGESKSVDRTLAPLDAHQATRALDIALTDISKTYGRKAARHVALFMEYPGFEG